MENILMGLVLIQGASLRFLAITYCSNKAKQLNKNEVLWELIAFLFPLLAIGIICLLNSKTKLIEE